MTFTANQVFPGIYHITDPMGVCVTLLVGNDAALLVDTAYGIGDLRGFIRTLTDKPLHVILTHAHHDHMLGEGQFDRVAMFPEDKADYLTYSNLPYTARVADSAIARGLMVDKEAFIAAAHRMPEPLTEQTVDLGSLTAQIIFCPGHTQGSCMVYVEKYRLLLTGDNWNPTTWLFFPRALGLWEYTANMREKALSLPFEQALCSHRPGLYPREILDAFFAGITPEAVASASPAPIPPYTDINTCRLALPFEQEIIFDMDKAVKEK